MITNLMAKIIITDYLWKYLLTCFLTGSQKKSYPSDSVISAISVTGTNQIWHKIIFSLYFLFLLKPVFPHPKHHTTVMATPYLNHLFWIISVSSSFQQNMHMVWILCLPVSHSRVTLARFCKAERKSSVRERCKGWNSIKEKLCSDAVETKLVRDHIKNTKKLDKVGSLCKTWVVGRPYIFLMANADILKATKYKITSYLTLHYLI